MDQYDLNRKINNVRFNQDFSCFSCAMESGFRIYNVEPLVEYHEHRPKLHKIGSIAICEMLFRGNYAALVGGGSRPKYAPNVLQVYDIENGVFRSRVTFNSNIIAVRLRDDLIIVALKDMVWLLTWPKLDSRIAGYPTYINKFGVLEMSACPCEKPIAIFPGNKPGVLNILDISRLQVNVTTSPVTLNCHENELACAALSMDSTKCATASTQGTLIRVWDMITKNLLVELRRGSDVATIYCINFSPTADYLCCSSDKGTVHIFAVANTSLNKRMLVQKTKLLGNYGESQYSLANFTLPPEQPCVCAFQSNNSVIALSVDGSLHKFIFNNDGNCNRDGYEIFLDAYDDFYDIIFGFK